jgi:hypothetical protein
MVDRRVPGFLRGQALAVTAAEVAAAKLQVKRAEERGLPVDPAIQAIADATPVASLDDEKRVIRRERDKRVIRPPTTRSGSSDARGTSG